MKDDPGVVVVRRMGRIDGCGAIDELEGEFVAPQLVSDDAEAMQRVGFVRRLLEHFTVTRLGFGEASALVMLEGVRERVCDRCFHDA